MKPWERYPAKGPWQSFGGASQPETSPVNVGQDAFADTLRAELEAAGPFARNLAGAGSAVVNAWEGLKGLVGNTDETQVAAQKVIASEAPIGNIAGNIAMLAPTALIPGANTVAGAATIGAVQGALLTPGDMKERAIAAGMGAAGGAAGAGLSKVMAAKAPIKANEDAGVLAKAGVSLTPGQNLGGAAARYEDKLMSLPIAGDVIRNARQRGFEDFNRVALNRVANQVGANVDDVGREGFSATKQSIDDVYGDLLPKLNNIQKDADFIQKMDELKLLAGNMPKDKADQLNNMINNYIDSRFTSAGRMSGETMKDVESVLGAESRAYRGSASPDDRKLGNALRQAQENLREMVERTNPQNAGELQKINRAYADYAVLRKAASMSGTAGNDGLFTPAQLNNAVRASDASAGRGAYASGKARMQDLSDPAMRVLPSKVPNSGTTDRKNAGSILELAKGLTASIPLSALYSRPGSAAVNSVMNKGALPLAELLRIQLSKNPDALRLLGMSLPAEFVGD